MAGSHYHEWERSTDTVAAVPADAADYLVFTGCPGPEAPRILRRFRIILSRPLPEATADPVGEGLQQGIPGADFQKIFGRRVFSAGLPDPAGFMFH